MLLGLTEPSGSAESQRCQRWRVEGGRGSNKGLNRERMHRISS